MTSWDENGLSRHLINALTTKFLFLRAVHIKNKNFKDNYTRIHTRGRYSSVNSEYKLQFCRLLL